MDQVLSAPAKLPKYFQAKIGKKLPKQFPEPLWVGKLDVSTLHSQILLTLCKPEITQNIFKEGQSQ